MAQGTGTPARLAPPARRTRTLALGILVRILLVVAAVIALLPFVALVRGAVAAVHDNVGGDNSLGVALSLAALVLGSLFFLYSVRYYLATLVMLLSSLVLSSGNGYTNGNGSGNGHGNGHPNGLMRLFRRGDGNRQANGNGNGNGHFDLGYEPFVSIHIATYNEERVIGRLLEGCAALEYGNYEVILVDDSTDQTTQILQAWVGRPRFKLFHRASRDGFKGGALQVALQQMDPRAEFVIVWDADVVPFPDSIQTFLPHFFKANGNGSGQGNGVPHAPEPRPEVAAVQSYQWHILNKSESWLTEAVRAEYAGSYMVERPFQEFIGSLKMIAGTAYMIRAPILRAFGWGRSLTEDWELTLRLHARGYKVVYTPYAESPAECVSTFGRLARQRMRWAEGHSYNVRRRFREIMGSPHLGLVEKVEFLYYSIYYLQAALFMVGSAAWLIAEVGLHAHVPEWTAVLGWSLLLTNLLSLPVMNFAGLLLEGAPAKDYIGILGALVTSFLLVPFQAYAAIKGMLERDEGPWYRTPKTGRVTDPVSHLRQLKWLRKWLGPLHRNPTATAPVHSTALPPPRPPQRLGWVVVAALLFTLGGIGYGALHAPVVKAAATTLYLYDPVSRGQMDVPPPVAVAPSTFNMTAAGNTFTWPTPATTGVNSLPAGTTVTMNYWSGGAAGATSNANLTFGYSANSSCLQITWIQNAHAIASSTTVSATMATAVGAGDLLAGVFRVQGAAPAVTDNINGAWTQAAINTVAGVTNAIWYFQNSKAAAAGALTVTLTSGTTGAIRISADEFFNVATAGALDQTSIGTTFGANWQANPTAAVAAGELVYSGFGTLTNNATVTPGTSNGAQLTIGGQQTDPANGTIASEYTVSSVAGAQNSSATLSALSITNVGTQATFKPPAGAITVIATIANTPLTLGGNLNTATITSAALVNVPSGSYFCWKVAVTSVTNGGLTLDVDAISTPTNLVISQTIIIPELALPFLGLAVIAPLAGRLRRRRSS